jgi:acyl carrier protein
MTVELAFSGDSIAIPGILRQILVDDLFVDVPPHEIGDDDSLRNVVGLDSLGFVELRAQCERAFGIQISEEDFTSQNFATIATVAGFVSRLAGK